MSSSIGRERKFGDRDLDGYFARRGVLLALVVLVSDFDDLGRGRLDEALTESDCLNASDESAKAAGSFNRALNRCCAVLTQIFKLQVLQAEVVEKVSPLLHFEDGRASQRKVELLAGSQHVCNVQWILCAPRRGASRARGEGGRGGEEATGGRHCGAAKERM